jgi:hypothetical protein
MVSPLPCSRDSYRQLKRGKRETTINFKMLCSPFAWRKDSLTVACLLHRNGFLIIFIVICVKATKKTSLDFVC